MKRKTSTHDDEAWTIFSIFCGFLVEMCQIFQLLLVKYRPISSRSHIIQISYGGVVDILAIDPHYHLPRMGYYLSIPQLVKVLIKLMLVVD